MILPHLHSGEFDVLVDHGNEETFDVDTIIAHHKYKPETYLNDIALIKVSKPIKFSRFILPACLPEQDFAEKVNLEPGPTHNPICCYSCFIMLLIRQPNMLMLKKVDMVL